MSEPLVEFILVKNKIVTRQIANCFICDRKGSDNVFIEGIGETKVCDHHFDDEAMIGLKADDFPTYRRPIFN